jgi:hypothetical protein
MYEDGDEDGDEGGDEGGDGDMQLRDLYAISGSAA